MRVTIFAIALLVSLSCRAEIQGPFVLGDATQLAPKNQPLRQVLSPSQLDAVSSWLEGRQAGWNAQITESSFEPVLASLHLIRRDGEIVNLSVVHGLKGDDYLRVWLEPSGHWADQSVLLKTKYADQPIDESAEKALLSICFKSTTP